MPPRPAQNASQNISPSPNNGGVRPTSSARVGPASGVVDGDGDGGTALPPTAVLLSDSVVPAQTVAVTVAIARTMTISLDSYGDSQNSIDAQPLSMSVPGVVPLWWAADPDDLWNAFYGFAVLVLLPLLGVVLGLLPGLRPNVRLGRFVRVDAAISSVSVCSNRDV